MTDHPDTDLTDPDGEAEALRRENERLREERDRFEAALARACLVGGTTYLIERAEAAEAALAASRAPDPVVNAGSCQPGDLISRIAAHPAVDEIAQEVANILARHIRALPAAPVAEALPTIGGAELDALVARLETQLSTSQFLKLGDLLEELNKQRAEAADAITALRAQPDWKAMAERLGDAGGKLDKAASEVIARGAQTGPQWSRLTAASLHFRAALSDLAKMKDATK